MTAADGQAARGARGQDGGGPFPPPVTRGERSAVQAARSAVKVDWLNATFPAPSLSVGGLLALLGRMLGRPILGVPGRGLFGFSEGVQLVARHGSEQSTIGHLAWGGDGQGGRWLLQFTGHGCAFVTDWTGVAALLGDLAARITRLDLALDFLNGEHTVDEALDVWEMGGFASGGRNPKTSFAGDWAGLEDGRTLYIGRAANGKSLRVYEKGRQLGDPDSPWTRFEVQFGNRDREIPLEALTDCEAFFAGAYPALEAFIDDAARAITTQRASGLVTLGHLLHHLRRCYGKVVHTLVAHAAAPDSELIEAVRVTKLPRRLSPTSTEAGVSWADVHAQSQRVSKCA